ncbi:hypothetical protein A5658_26485 [Mycobacterium sp. 1245111.1]|nr:hypothetical protein A5658_26485 [Mycobacterium sp. 1245111.1]
MHPHPWNQVAGVDLAVPVDPAAPDRAAQAARLGRVCTAPEDQEARVDPVTTAPVGRVVRVDPVTTAPEDRAGLVSAARVGRVAPPRGTAMTTAATSTALRGATD